MLGMATRRPLRTYLVPTSDKLTWGLDMHSDDWFLMFKVGLLKVHFTPPSRCPQRNFFNNYFYL